MNKARRFGNKELTEYAALIEQGLQDSDRAKELRSYLNKVASNDDLKFCDLRIQQRATLKQEAL